MMLPTTISFSQTYVALAGLLPADLRPRASCAGLCYFEVKRMTTTDYYQVQAAALSHYLNGFHPRKVYAVLLHVDEIAQGLPLDHDLQGLPTCDLRELVEQHVCRVGGRLPQPTSEQQALPQPPVSRREDAHLVSLAEDFYVSSEAVADAASRLDAPQSAQSNQQKRRRGLQLVWLQAAMLMIRRQIAYAKAISVGGVPTFYHALYRSLRAVFRICRRTCLAGVSAEPVYVEDRLIGWSLHVGMPSSLNVG